MSAKKVWVVVVVLSGIACEAHVFRNKRLAEAKLREARIDLRQDYDDADVFEVEIQE